tara:strand:- start:429 stop:1100 length:672 start_codon:yes stop_codon:yes gene_type:complete
MKLKSNVKLLITCDSGAAAGKTTASKYLSRQFGLELLTSGLLYRYVAYKLLTSKKKSNDIKFLKKIIKKIRPKLLKNSKLYSIKVTAHTIEIAKIKKVRMLLKKYQKKFSLKRLAILEGRDMGILFPKADIKFFFKCSLNVAAKRRFREFKKTNKKINYKMVKKAIKIRNHIDSTRKFSPLRIPRGAVIVDTTNMNKKQTFRKISKIVERKLFLKYGRNYKTR